MKNIFRALGAVVLVMALGSSPALGQDRPLSERPLPDKTLAAIRELAIQHNGRNKPFDSFAREALQQVTGQSAWQGQDPVQTLVSLLAWPDGWNETALISVPFLPLREALGMDPHARSVSMSELFASRKLMKMLPEIVQKQQRSDKLSMLENETMDAYGRFVTLTRLFEHDLALAPPPAGATHPVWGSIAKLEGYSPEQQSALRETWGGFILAIREGNPDAIDGAFQKLQAELVAVNPAQVPAKWRLRLEVSYNRSRPFLIARWTYALAALLLVGALVANKPPVGAAGMGLFILAMALHASGIALRVILGGRPPVSNFYETMLWLPFVAALLAMIFERIYRLRYFALSASLVCAIVLTLASYVPLDSSITPVVAVLRSNFWLTIHVLIIVASYGALALAVVLAHIEGVQFMARPDAGLKDSPLGLLIYRTLQVGVVLLAGGIMLGAVWANASWGRYWGWDPKETWALITLLWYLALLHGRFAGWIRGVGVSLATIIGFFLLLMTYYGVSFYLVGLHSYAGGNAKPLPTLLVFYLIAEVVFIALVGWAAAARRRLI